LNPPLVPDSWEDTVVDLTQSQLVTAVADRAELTKNNARRDLSALEEIVLEELGNAQKVRITGPVQLTVRVKPATKKRPRAEPGHRRRDRDRRKAG
jgi:nucleoid DNA-binding protein